MQRDHFGFFLSEAKNVHLFNFAYKTYIKVIQSSVSFDHSTVISIALSTLFSRVVSGGMGSGGTSFVPRTPEEFLSNVSEMDAQDGGMYHCLVCLSRIVIIILPYRSSNIVSEKVCRIFFHMNPFLSMCSRKVFNDNRYLLKWCFDREFVAQASNQWKYCATFVTSWPFDLMTHYEILDNMILRRIHPRLQCSRIGCTYGVNLNLTVRNIYVILNIRHLLECYQFSVWIAICFVHQDGSSISDWIW